MGHDHHHRTGAGRFGGGPGPRSGTGHDSGDRGPAGHLGAARPARWQHLRDHPGGGLPAGDRPAGGPPERSGRGRAQRSPRVNADLGWAFDHASRHHLALHAVHAYTQPVYTPDGAQESPAELAQRTTQVEDLLLHEEVAGFVELYPDVTLTSQAVHDSAAHALIQASQDASLVVMGTRAHSLVMALLVGSPPQVVAPRSPCSVAVIPHRGTAHE
ncbi:MAG TPA: universal stress protein [Candidatus Limnocylindrales bacterium]|nr:universal stress protein [Candidatus Limnocylindrales bacterium]